MCWPLFVRGGPTENLAPLARSSSRKHLLVKQASTEGASNLLGVPGDLKALKSYFLHFEGVLTKKD